MALIKIVIEDQPEDQLSVEVFSSPPMRKTDGNGSRLTLAQEFALKLVQVLKEWEGEEAA